jgi:heme/copper-type cytochrome/quinol oxidase subunit 4
VLGVHGKARTRAALWLVARNPTTLVIGGSLWIMDHLNQNMMPMHQMMQMQR